MKRFLSKTSTATIRYKNCYTSFFSRNQQNSRINVKRSYTSSWNVFHNNFGALNSMKTLNSSYKTKNMLNSFMAGGAAVESVLPRRFVHADNNQQQKNLSIDEINGKIDSSEVSALINDSQYVYGVCSAQYAANTPIEDTYSASKMENGVLFGVFDGHAGDGTSKFAQQHVLQNVANLLRKQPQGIAQILKTAFEQTDQQLLKQYGLDSGAVALVSYIDNKSGCLYTANAGDCGAVLGYFDEKQKQYKAANLSEQHNTDNPREVSRIAAEHPGEEVLSDRGYLKGMLLPTRALGDFALKYYINERLKKHLPSPPYITATPQVIGRKLNSGDRFLIMASDGLWDVFSTEEAVQLVADMLHQRGESELMTGNAASYLIKQALLQTVPTKSGSIADRMSAIMSVPTGMKRRVHDDITVTVVFLRDKLSDKELQKSLKNVNADLQNL